MASLKEGDQLSRRIRIKTVHCYYDGDDAYLQVLYERDDSNGEQSIDLPRLNKPVVRSQEERDVYNALVPIFRCWARFALVQSQSKDV